MQHVLVVIWAVPWHCLDACQKLVFSITNIQYLYSQINHHNYTIVLIVCISHCTVCCGDDWSVGGVMTHPLNEPGIKLIEIGRREMRQLQQVEVELTQSKEENQLLYMEKQDQSSRFFQLQQLLQDSQEREQQAREKEFFINRLRKYNNLFLPSDSV